MNQQNQHGQFENENSFANEEIAPIKVKQPEEEPMLGSILNQLGDVPNDRVLKPDALEHDIRLGWIPRSQVTGPIPLSFSQENYDWVIENKKQQLIYLGYRPATTFELHQRYYGEGKNYPFYQFHLCKAKFLDRFFKKYYSDYIFEGRQPEKVKENTLSFDSYYEGGNLDAVYFEQNEYRLLLRVDSNTLGHCNYYNFKVRPSQTGRFVFRIMNITKWKSLYQKGMKPYVKKLKNDLNNDFQQAGSNVRFGDSPLNEEFQIFRLKSMKFEYTFDQANVEYQFCYTIPYTYSELYSQVKGQKYPYTHLSKLCHSLSGIQIPLLTISAPDREETKDTYVIAMIGRVHPSEATGSHIVNGVIKYLTSENKEAKWLRNKVIFKIIPMLNPDGVIMGNTRTGVAGKDLNRQYRKNNDIVFPEVISIIDYVMKLKQKYGKRLLFFIDIHGHSTRKNSFFFGPEYPIIDEQYTKCRLLPRYYSVRTDIFRYYSCKYKVATYKEQTARGYFNTNGIRTYTHQTSQHCFFDFSQRKDKAFTRDSLENLGKDLSLSMYDFLKQMMGNDVPVPPIPEKKKMIRVNALGKQQQVEEQEELSEEDGSDKNDSEDEAEDFQQRKLMQFFNKINENRQYFYEELVASQGGVELSDRKPKDDRKRKKSDSLKSDDSRLEVPYSRNTIQLNLEEQLLGKKETQKIDWVSKVIYPQKKKNLQEYPKLSSVIFGSSVPDYFINKRDNPYASVMSSNKITTNNFGMSTKYSVNYINAEFRSTQSKYPSPQHRIFKSTKGFKQYESQRLQKECDPIKIKLLSDPKTKQRYLRLKEEILPTRISHHQFFTSAQEQFQRRQLLNSKSRNSLKPVPICAVELGEIASQKKQEEKELMKMTTSLKVLTRKKSIKNIRQSESMQNRKISKSLKGSSLSKKLPSLANLRMKI